MQFLRAYLHNLSLNKGAFSNGLKKIPDKLMIILGKHLWVPRGGGFCGDIAPALDAEYPACLICRSHQSTGKGQPRL